VIPDFGHFFSQDGMNSVFFSFNKYNFSFLAAGFCPKKLGFVPEKIMALPESGGAGPNPLAMVGGGVLGH